MTSTRLENLRKMREKYLDLGQDVAAARVEARIAELEPEEPDPPRLCDQCGCIPCRCDEDYDNYQDRMMFPDDT